MILTLSLAIGCEAETDYKVNIGQYIEHEVLEIEGYGSDSIKNVFLLKKDDGTTICQEIDSNGYSGIIKSLVYIDVASREVSSVSILSHTETSDYGGYVIEDWFLRRYNERNVDRPLETVIMAEKKDNDIIAITGATITTNTVTKAVNDAMENFLKIEGDNNVF